MANTSIESRPRRRFAVDGFHARLAENAFLQQDGSGRRRGWRRRSKFRKRNGLTGMLLEDLTGGWKWLFRPSKECAYKWLESSSGSWNLLYLLMGERNTQFYLLPLRKPPRSSQ